MDKEKLIKLAEDLYQSAFDANAYYAIMMQYREMSKKYNNEMNLSPAFYQVVYGALQKACFMEIAINTLLGSPRKLICQCCGMPLEDDDIIGHNHDGSFNEDYCKWCYADGTYTYNDMDDLIEVCVKNMVSENFTEEQARSYSDGIKAEARYVTLDDLYELWKDLKRGLKNNTFENYKIYL